MSKQKQLLCIIIFPFLDTMSATEQASECFRNPLAMICIPVKQESPIRRIDHNPPAETPVAKSLAEEPNCTEVSIAAQPLAVLPPAGRALPVSNLGLHENGSNETETEDDKKRERGEHKKRSKNWTRVETLKLIRLRTELEPRFARSGRKSELWDEIAETLQRESISRDAQQCRDKWEKLTAGYKEVRDGLREREDNPFFDELDPLLSGKSHRKDRNEHREIPPKEAVSMTANAHEPTPIHRDSDAKENFLTEDEETEEGSPARKRRKETTKYITATDLDAVRELLESLVSRQQRFFTDLLDSMERKEQIREQIRQEKEDKWRAEERAQRCVFNNAMIVLTKKLMDETKIGVGGGGVGVIGGLGFESGSTHRQQEGSVGGVVGGGPKKRSKNWKRAEVLQLIKFRAEMESRFAKSTRRAALWDELAELLAAEGIKRDGKQCREKWDKLMAEYKDVSDGKRDRGESPYFAELTAIVGRSADAA